MCGGGEKTNWNSVQNVPFLLVIFPEKSTGPILKVAPGLADTMPRNNSGTGDSNV